MAKVPPWPSSSAERTIKQYLTVTMRVSDQIIIDRAPTMSCQEGCLVKVELKT